MTKPSLIGSPAKIVAACVPNDTRKSHRDRWAADPFLRVDNNR